jgi:hypothetical protein
MLFTYGSFGAPPSKSFKAGETWEEHRFKLEDFAGSDGTSLMGLFIGAGADAGPFELLIDDVRFELAGEGSLSADLTLART